MPRISLLSVAVFVIGAGAYRRHEQGDWTLDALDGSGSGSGASIDNQQITGDVVVVTGIEQIQWFKFDRPSGLMSAGFLDVRQCRNGSKVWSGEIKWEEDNNGGSHGRWSISAEHQFVIGDLIIHGADGDCTISTGSPTIAAETSTTTAVVVTGIEQIQWFKFDRPSGLMSAGFLYVRQCRNGSKVWSGEIKWEEDNNGGSHGRRNPWSISAEHQFVIGDLIISGADGDCTISAGSPTTAAIFTHMEEFEVTGCMLQDESSGLNLPQGAEPYTFEAEVYQGANNPKDAHLYSWGTRSRLKANAMQFYGKNRTSLRAYWGAGNLTTNEIGGNWKGQWRHVGQTWDGKFRRIWVDGEIVAEKEVAKEVPQVTPGDNLCLGTSGLRSKEHTFVGKMRNVKIWAAAQDLSEIAGSPVEADFF